MLSSSHPYFTFLLIGLSRFTLSRCRSWATLRLKELVTSKPEGPFSGCVSYGFCGEAGCHGARRARSAENQAGVSIDLPHV